MRIALITETYPPEVNGVAHTVARFAQGLRRIGHEIQIVRPRQRGDANIDTHGGARGNDAHGIDAEAHDRSEDLLCSSLPIPRYPQLRMGLPATSRLVQAWRTRRPDLVHIATEGPLGWSAQRAAAQLKLPVSSDFRTNFQAYSSHYGIGWLSRPILAYLRAFHNRTARTLVPTEALRRELTRQRFENVQVVARGVDVDLFDPRRRSLALRTRWLAGPQTLVVIHVGRLAAEKNLDLVFRSFEAMRHLYADTRLVIVGDGPERARLERQHPWAHFAGVQTGEALAVHYASADVFLFPSLTETFGNVTLEALASGLAVLAYDYAAAAAHIAHDRSGLLADFADAGRFVALAMQLADHPVTLAPMRASARRSAQAVGWDALVRQFEAVLHSVSDAGLRSQPTASQGRLPLWVRSRGS